MSNNIFRKMNSATQLFCLVAFSFTGLVLGSIISTITGLALGIDISQNLLDQPIYFLQLNQIISTLFWLLIPAIIFIKLFYGNLNFHLNSNHNNSLLFILASLLIVFTVQPIIAFSGYINYNVIFPESLLGLEKTFKELTETNTALINYLFSQKTVLSFIANIFVVAVLAAALEEVFFRGCLQQLIQKILKNSHAAVWLTAIIFSAVHLDFYGFLPRILLGAMLGYLYLWSGQIWIPILAHFLNNLTAVILKYLSLDGLEDMEKYVPSENIVYIILSIIFTYALTFFLSRNKVNTIRF